MREYKYLVLEIHPAYAIVLENNGRIIKVANIGLTVGDRTDNVLSSDTRKEYQF